MRAVEKKKKLVPPDGGYGWVVVFAFASFNFLAVPMLQNFALIFRNTFREIGLSATNESFIVTSGLAIGMLAGISYGPLLKLLGYRKFCLISAFSTTFGTLGLMFANSMLGFVVTYGLFTSIGIASGMTGFSIALNTYFVKKKSFATGFAFTLTCLGSILMPQLISFLLNEYGVKGTLLVLTGLTMNTFASALLLHPVKWHMKEVDEDEDEEANHRINVYTIKLKKDAAKKEVNASTTTIASDPNIIVVQKERTGFRKFIYNVVHLFDLSLLKDMHFLNLLIGIALATFAEQGFSSLTPFILSDLDFSIHEIATFISCLSISDLIFRFITPFVGNYFKTTARNMCILSFLLLTLSRFTLLFRPESFTWIVVIALGLGVGKGVRTVYWTLVLPEYLPLELLPSASGLHMVINGIILLIGGPLLGVARDLTGNYVNCIYITNSITILGLLTWIVEIIYVRCKSTKTLEITKL